MRPCSASASGLSIEVEFTAVQKVIQSVDARAAGARRSTSTWPLVLCGLFAVVAAVVAVAQSPLGAKPQLRPYVEAVRASTSSAWGSVRLLDPRAQTAPAATEGSPEVSAP